ncbi:MAG: PIN domain-containing protein [Solirubrobacteraceae bacterium]
MSGGADATVDEFLTATKRCDRRRPRYARRAAQLRARHRSRRLGDALSLGTARAHDAQLLSFEPRFAARGCARAARPSGPAAAIDTF